MTTPLPRDEFAVTRQYVYLNHAAAGALPHASVAAIEAFVRAHAEAGVLGTFPYDQRLPEYRERIGRFIGAGGAEIAILLNTSAAANTVALGLDLAPGDEVLLADDEFPANAIPWIGLRRRGVDVRLLRSNEGRLTPERLRREISSRTRAVTVSWVGYHDGYRHDLAGLAAIAHDAGAVFCVDAIQGLGALPINVRALGVDALYAGAGKWLLGLHGAALLYVAAPLGERLQLAMPGWRSLENMWEFHAYEQPFSTEALRFESGTPNVIGAISLAESVSLFERAGVDAIARHVLMLTDRLYAGLSNLGAELSTVRGEGISSGIVTFEFPGHDTIALGQALEREAIVATYRAGGIRLSPHGYTTVEEIDFTLETLARATRTVHV